MGRKRKFITRFNPIFHPHYLFSLYPCNAPPKANRFDQINEEKEEILKSIIRITNGWTYWELEKFACKFTHKFVRKTEPPKQSIDDNCQRRNWRARKWPRRCRVNICASINWNYWICVGCSLKYCIIFAFMGLIFGSFPVG